MDKSLPIETHPIWGRNISLYTKSYGLDIALDTRFDSDLECALLAKAQEGIRQICELIDDRFRKVTDAHTVARQIHISTLQYVMNLALSPHTLHVLACPPLISGCIRLMSTVKISDKPSVSHRVNRLSCFLKF